MFRVTFPYEEYICMVYKSSTFALFTLFILYEIPKRTFAIVEMSSRLHTSSTMGNVSLQTRTHKMKWIDNLKIELMNLSEWRVQWAEFIEVPSYLCDKI